jgi:O-antigen/teichoic acid export membrane protein
LKEDLNPLVGQAVTGRTVAAKTAGSLLLFGLLKARGLLVLPLYSRLFHQEEWGICVLAVNVATLTSFTVQAGLAQGLLVQLPHLPDRASVSAAYHSVLRFVLSLAAAAGAVLLIVSWTRPDWPLVDELAPHAAVIGALALGYALRDITLVLPQLHRDTHYLSAMNLFFDYGGAVLGLALAAAGYGIRGFLWGTAAVLLAGAGFALRRASAIAGPSSVRAAGFLKGALAVSLPLFAIGLGQAGVQNVDRFLLAEWRSAAEVGVYGMAYSVASATLAVSAGLSMVFLPVAVNLLYHDRLRLVRFVEEAIRSTMLILGLCIAGAFALGAWTLAVLAPRYREGGPLLPYMVLAYAVLTLAQVLQWVPMAVDRRTGGVVASYLGAAVLNVVLDVMWIPRWAMAGAVGAAIASYAASALLLAALARQSLPELRLRRAWPAALLMTASASLAACFPVPTGAPLGIAVAAAVAVVSAYVAMGTVLGAIRIEDWRRLRGLVG